MDTYLKQILKNSKFVENEYMYSEEDDFEYELSEEGIKLFEERRAKRLSGESKIFSWQEAKEMITGKKKLE